MEKRLGFIRKHLSADGMIKIVQHSLHREPFKVIKNSEYSWQDCIMSGLAVFGFKMPSLLQFEKDKATEPFIRRNLRTLYGVDKAPSDTCMRERLDEVIPLAPEPIVKGDGASKICLINYSDFFLTVYLNLTTAKLTSILASVSEYSKSSGTTNSEISSPVLCINS